MWYILQFSDVLHDPSSMTATDRARKQEICQCVLYACVCLNMSEKQIISNVYLPHTAASLAQVNNSFIQ